MPDRRDIAWQTAQEFGTLLETEGYSSFLEAVGTSVVNDAELQTVLFGAITAELNYRVREQARPELSMPALNWPLDQDGFYTFGSAVSQTVDVLRPSDEFCAAVGGRAAIRAALRLPEGHPLMIGGKDISATEQAVNRGQGNTGTRSVGLLPIVTDIYRTTGVTDQDVLVQLTRLSGSGLLYDLALSSSRFEAFDRVLDGYCQGFAGKPFLVGGHVLYEPGAPLAEAFGPLFDFVDDPNGNERIVWAGDKTINIGCVTTLLTENFLTPAWDRTVDIAAQTGFYAQL